MRSYEICLNKLSLKGSTIENYKELGVLPLHSDNSHIREIRKYDCPVKYTYKSFGQTFVDYLGPTYYNSMPLDFKRNINYKIE
ncbi:putative RNA-directed DNA polymerase [Aphis craccivora]|uniref:Putative RNA-directed DNA polymerase n=1 Tax=Aphis craccivora TaxID=307492 RepID=A0A6G0YD87_APHCR|nr:putative RNA-directed DNA polymerase [Aphis craccivora]